jgi:serine/threonine-protein kinase
MREHTEVTLVGIDRLVGTVLDARYRISHKLAEGGFGAIYRATDLATGQDVALKMLHRELLGDASVVTRFHREANVLARLRDSHTIRMYEAHDEYIVLELLRGESLFEVYKSQGKLPWQRVATIARGVCSSLRELHAMGFVHRDLKPSNIHLEDGDFVKVLDFGIAKQIDTEHTGTDLTAVGQVVGTFDYMPPEQLLGTACSANSDVFTLGVVIYEMIAGYRPFTGGTGAAGNLMAILGDDPAALLDVPPELSRIVMQALEREPADRPTVDELDGVLERLLAWQDEDEDTVVAARHTFIGFAPSPRMPSPPSTVRFAAGSQRELEPSYIPQPRPTPSEFALPPPPRFATGTNPIINKKHSAKSPVRYMLWAVGLFGVGFAAALGLGAIL